MEDNITKEDKLLFIKYFSEVENKFKEYEKFYKSYNNLLNNKDFKRVILEGYLKDEAIRLVSSLDMHIKKSTPETVSWCLEQDKLIQDSIKAINYFEEFINSINLRYERIKSDYEQMKKEVDLYKSELLDIENGISYTKIEEK